MDPTSIKVIKPLADADALEKNVEPLADAAGDGHESEDATDLTANKLQEPESLLIGDPNSAKEKPQRSSRDAEIDEEADVKPAFKGDAEGDSDNRPVLYNVDEDPEEEQNTEADVEDPNWQWPAYDEVVDNYGATSFVKRKRRLSREKGSPFQVIYRDTRAGLWPDIVQIKLKSPQLMRILSKYLPDQKGLQYMGNVDVNGREVWIILDVLQKHPCSDDNDHSRSPDAGMLAENGPFKESDFESRNPNGPIQVPKVGSNEAERIHQKDNSTTTVISELGSKNITSEERHGTKQSENKGRLHLKHLLRFMDEEYKDVALKHQHMMEEKSASFDMLWTFLKPGAKVVYTCAQTQELLCAIVSNNEYVNTDCGFTFSVTLDVWDYNGTVYRKCKTVRNIPSFSGESPLDSLGIWPIELDRGTTPEVLEAGFISKGRKFQELVMQSSNCFMYYQGPICQIKERQLFKEKADGRVMIDLRNFARMNPTYPMKNAQPPASYGKGDRHSRWGPMGFPPPGPPPGLLHSTFDHSYMDNDAEDAFTTVGIHEISDDTLLFAPAIAYGFSFSLKQWGAFAVTGFTDISFDVNSFDALVMEPELKGLVYTIVSQYIARSASETQQSDLNATRVDPIATKGEGCVFLCYGPPGTGKTLTAESIAENMRRPLWALSVSELGTTPGDLEKTLTTVLEVAAMWKAVLLLDEADVYLEKRDVSVDITRNAMTGVFMRLLEYYRGVLFLTTNRIMTFDDAFRSRISLFLRYPKLNGEQREQIWRSSLARVQAGKGDDVKVSKEFLKDISRQEMNGREIRNAIHLAQTFASSANENVQEKHLKFVLRVVTKSSDTLSGVLQMHNNDPKSMIPSRTDDQEV